MAENLLKLANIENKRRKVVKILRKLLACVMIASITMTFAGITASAETSFNKVIETTVTEINNEKGVVSTDNSFVMYLGETDYMTATEWNNHNYKWFNAVGTLDYLYVDLTENNLCNFPFDKHLDEYNFEQKILIDGVTLAEYKQDHPYSLTGNKLTRVNTISIDFDEPVLSSVTTIEILEGCEFPTLRRACRGEDETSCIKITERTKYENHDGIWALYFEGYKDNLEYNGDEKMLFLTPSTTYKNHTTLPLVRYDDFFNGRNVAGEIYYGKVLASNGNSRKDSIAVLKFVHPIDASQFNQISLKVYMNHKRTIVAYNDEGITNDSLGIALESFTLSGAVYTTLNLTSSLYADSDGMVRSIVFRLNEDGEPYVDENGNQKYNEVEDFLERDQIFFISFHVGNRDVSEILSKDSFMIVENGDAYDVTFRFNKQCEDTGVSLDTSKVILNGKSLKKILSECKTATAQWNIVGVVCQINLTIPKSYDGSAQIKNADKDFVGNSMGVEKGLAFPDGSLLEKTYTCHLYVGENILDADVGTNFAKTTVLSVGYEFVKGSDNLHFKIRFDKKITTANYNHACELERWRENDLVASNPLYYDKGISNVFVKNGFKSSLLDKIVINGKTIGDWHAEDSRALTNIQTHYGQSGLEYVDVHFESASLLTYNQVADFARAGNGITIEIKEGLKFLTNCSVQKTQTFILKDGTFIEQLQSKGIHVYFDGSEVQNGASVTVKRVVAPTSVVVEGVLSYEISHLKNGNVTEYTVTYDGGQEFKFTVTEDAVKEEVSKPTESPSKGGCGSSVEMPFIGVLLASFAIAVTLKERKIHE